MNIHNIFTSKRGITYHYTIYTDRHVEIYKSSIRRCSGGWKTAPDEYRKPTKELIQALKERHGIDLIFE